MSHRAAAITAAILAPFGIAVAAPVVTNVAGVSVAHAGDDNGSPSDDLTNENPPPVDQQPPAQPPVTPAPTPTPAPTTPVLPPLPPMPQDTLQNESSNSNSGGGSNNSGSGSGSGGQKGIEKTIPTRRLSVRASTTNVVSDTGAIPQGGVQAGGGGTAPSLHDAGSGEGALGAAIGLVLVVTGTGLAMRRRPGAE